MTPPGPIADHAPALAELAAIGNPIERAQRIGDIARTYGTLPKAYAALRLQTVAELVADERTPGWIARKLGISSSLGSRLVKRCLAAPAGQTTKEADHG